MKRLMLCLMILMLTLSVIAPTAPHNQAVAGDEGATKGELEKCLGADTLAVVGVRHWNELSARFKRTPYYAAFTSPEMKKFFEGPINQLKEAIREEEPDLESALEDLMAFPSGQAALVLHKFKAPEPGEYDPEVGFSLFCHVGENRAAVEAWINKMVTRLSDEAAANGTYFGKQTVQHGGDTITRLLKGDESNPEALNYYLGSSYFVVGLDNIEEIKQIITHYGNGTSVANSLDSDAQFRSAMTTCGQDPDLYFYVNLKGLLNQVDDTAEAGEMGPTAAMLLDALGVRDMTSLAAGLSFRSTHMEAKVFVGAPAPRKGLMSLLNMPVVSKTPPKYVGGDVCSFSAIGFDVPQVWDVIVDIVSSLGEEIGMYFQMGVGAAKDQFGLDIENDFFKAIGKTTTSYGFVERPFTEKSFHQVMVTEVTNGEALSGFLNTAVDLIVGNLGGAATVDSVEYMGKSINMVKMSLPEFDDEGNFEMVEREFASFGVVDNALVIGKTGESVKHYIRMLKEEAPENTLASNKTYQDLVARFAPGDVSMIVYGDSKDMLEYYDWYLKELVKANKGEESAIRSDAGLDMILGFLTEAGFDINLIPSLKALSECGRHRLTTIKVGDDGLTMGSFCPYPTVSDR